MVGCQECGSHAIFIRKVQISLGSLFQKFQVAITSSLVVASGHFSTHQYLARYHSHDRTGCLWNSLPTKLVNQWQGRMSPRAKLIPASLLGRQSEQFMALNLDLFFPEWPWLQILRTTMFIKGQDESVGRYTLPPCTTKKRTTTNLKTKINQKFQKI